MVEVKSRIFGKWTNCDFKPNEQKSIFLKFSNCLLIITDDIRYPRAPRGHVDKDMERLQGAN